MVSAGFTPQVDLATEPRWSRIGATFGEDANLTSELAVAYVTRGYVFYVTGLVPGGKDPARVDAKLCARYGVGLSKWARARRRTAGCASFCHGAA